MTSAGATAFVLTGRHVLACLLLFFGCVFAVNFYMARVAIQTFSGLEAAKPYQEGIKYDEEIARARAQDERHWSVEASLRPAAPGFFLIDIHQKDAGGFVTPGLNVTATFMHPADRRRDVSVEVPRIDAGHFAAPVQIAQGRWNLRIEARDSQSLLFRSESRVELVR